MVKTIFALSVILFATLIGCAFADTTKSAEKCDRLLLQWTSQQQMNWDIRINAQNFRFLAVQFAALDTGNEQKVIIAPDGASLILQSDTSWNTGFALVDIERGKTENVSIDIQDPYVKDRHTVEQFSLTDLQQERIVTIHSKEWPIRNCMLRLTMDPAGIEQKALLLKDLGTDRIKNVKTLLAFADRTENKARRLDLLLRAAAACSGGCNHGPLEPDGWEQAIAIYQRVINEYKDTDAALDALWVQASCYSCWSPCSGCDADGRGKSYRDGRDKHDWETSFELYEKLYKISHSPSDKANALRRMAEVQCFVATEWDAGLKNYRKIAVEFPGSLPPSPRWTYRTCAPYCETEHLAWDIYRAIVYNARDERSVQSIFDEYFGNIKGNPHIDELVRYIQVAGARKQEAP